MKEGDVEQTLGILQLVERACFILITFRLGGMALWSIRDALPQLDTRNVRALQMFSEVPVEREQVERERDSSRARAKESLMRELPLALPLRPWGIAHSSLQKRHQLCSARVRCHTVFDTLAPLAKHSADILVPPRRQIPAQCGFFRSHLLVICAAKLRYTAAAAREHRRVLAPRLPTP